jgi:zinc and cadmium transporter
MSTLFAIVLACLAGGVLSVLVASVVGLTPLHRHAPTMISFAVGVLLAAALLDLLPAAAAELDMQTVGMTLLAGVVGFFILEKLALWRHDHAAPKGPSRSAVGLTLTLGDGCHNFVDGLLLAAAFTQDPKLGLAMTIAIVAHEIPQEIGDFFILIAAGYTRRQALMLNVIASLGSLLGGVLGYFVLQHVQGITPYALTIAAASFLYIAIADLVPMLQAARRPRDFALQLPLLLGGMAVVFGGLP